MPGTSGQHLLRVALLAAIAAVTAGCQAASDPARSVEIRRTAHGIAHIEAPDYESLAYGVAYAHARDNVCQTANHLVTIRGERSRWFGPEAAGLLGLRMLPNAVSDVFIRAHMDDAALAKAQSTLSAEAQALAHGYVAGYNRYLEDHGSDLPAACAGQSWVRPMTHADYLRLQELTMVQLGVALMADAVFGAAPPPAPEASAAAATPAEAAAALPTPAEVALALAPYHLNEPLLGSNGWAFGAEVTRSGRGVMLGNPHFPWVGVNRFWEMHLTIPGRLDVMGAAIGHSPVVQIGFNDDVAWTHTVSTGKRFTLHELELVSGEPTAYMLDGERVAMTREEVSFPVPDGEGEIVERKHVVWQTLYGPVLEIPDAGLVWGKERAYAVKDANTLNLRAMEIWIGLNRADSVEAMRDVLARLGVPWVNTIAADRHGSVMYADVSVVPDVDAGELERCRPSDRAAALFAAAGLVVLDGSRSECGWHRDPESPVPGLMPIERMPVAIRRDWVQNSNNSFWLSNPAIEWPEFSPLVGATEEKQSLRTRSGLRAIRERLAGEDGIAEHGEIGLEEVQAMLFANRNYAAEIVLDDLLELCGNAVGTTGTDSATGATGTDSATGAAGTDSAAAADSAAGATDTDGAADVAGATGTQGAAEVAAAMQEGCRALADWDRRADLDSRGEHLFREWWRAARGTDGVWRVPFDPARPATTPTGLNTEDPAVREQLLAALDSAISTVREAGYALDAPLGDVQHKTLRDGTVGVPGGPEFEGVLNKVEAPGTGTLPESGYEINFGSSYIQTVTFDERGPVAEAIMTYGQSPHPASPYAFDQLALFQKEQWLPLPFHPEDVEAATIGEPLHLAVDSPPLP